jgi:hypothetical protein
MVAGMVSATGCGSAPVAAPTAYTAYNSKGGTFACEYPEGWEADGGGGRGPEWAKFISGPALIHITTGLTGSVLNEIGTANQGTQEGPIPPELEPIHGIHMQGVEEAEREYSGYKETGEPEVLEVSLGPARKSEFASTTSFGSGLRGYRATVAGHDKAVHVICICPDSDWSTLQPAFDTVLSSLKRGHAE